MKTSWRAAPLAIALLACTGGTTPTDHALFSASDNVDRVVSSVVFDTLWVLGGPDDTLLASPVFPQAYGDGGLVFFDLQDQRVHRVGADGRLAWSWGRKGEGPGELQNVRALDVDGSGNVLLVDSRRFVAITLDPNGVLLDEKPVDRSGGLIGGASVLEGGGVAVHASRIPWGVWDGESIRPATGVPAAWSEMPRLQNQGQLAVWREDGWVFGFGVGNGWMVFRGSEVVGAYPYVEHYDFPEVIVERRGMGTVSRMTERPPSTGSSVSVVGDTLHVFFGGTSEQRGRMLDAFDVTTGRYLTTHMLPHYANRAVMDQSGRVFTVENWGVFPTIVALASRSPE